MDVYIVRHGIAEERSANQQDADRELSAEGKKKMKEEAAGFARLEREVEAIFSSPLVRARQTAEILASPLKKAVEEMQELAPGYSPKQVLARLQKLGRTGGVMLVGHEPNCSELTAYLLAVDAEVEFKKGAICLIQLLRPVSGSGTLIWHLSPQILRFLAK